MIYATNMLLVTLAIMNMVGVNATAGLNVSCPCVKGGMYLDERYHESLKKNHKSDHAKLQEIQKCEESLEAVSTAVWRSRDELVEKAKSASISALVTHLIKTHDLDKTSGNEEKLNLLRKRCHDFIEEYVAMIRETQYLESTPACDWPEDAEMTRLLTQDTGTSLKSVRALEKILDAREARRAQDKKSAEKRAQDKKAQKEKSAERKKRRKRKRRKRKREHELANYTLPQPASGTKKLLLEMEMTNSASCNAKQKNDRFLKKKLVRAEREMTEKTRESSESDSDEEKDQLLASFNPSATPWSRKKTNKATKQSPGKRRRVR